MAGGNNMIDMIKMNLSNPDRTAEIAEDTEDP